jgi:hypothetical protein
LKVEEKGLLSLLIPLDMRSYEKVYIRMGKAFFVVQGVKKIRAAKIGGTSSLPKGSPRHPQRNAPIPDTTFWK